MATQVIQLDHGNRCVVTREPQQVIVTFELGGTVIDMAMTVHGAKLLAAALSVATQQD